jgi:hypothetical protein
VTGGGAKGDATLDARRWYECDAIIREKTDAAKSLDEFCKRPFAAVSGKQNGI